MAAISASGSTPIRWTRYPQTATRSGLVSPARTSSQMPKSVKQWATAQEPPGATTMRHDATSLERKEGTAIGTHPPFAFGLGDDEKGQAKMKSHTGWSLDRRVPLAVILTIATQTAAALLWAGAAGERLTALEVRTER